MNKCRSFMIVVISLISISIGGPNSVLEAPIQLKRPYSISKKIALENSLIFTVGKVIDMERKRGDLFFKQEGKYVDPRSILYELYTYPYFREAIEEIESHQEKARAMLHLGVHSTWIISPIAGAGFFIGRGFRLGAAKKCWYRLIDEYNELIEKGSIVYIKKDNSEITLKQYDPQLRTSYAAVLSQKYANIWLKASNAPVNFTLRGSSNFSSFSHTFKIKMPRIKANSLNIEFGHFFKDNFWGYKGYWPLPFKYSLDNFKFISDSTGATIEFKKAKIFTFGGFFTYKRKFPFLNNHLSLGLSINAGFLPIIFYVDREVYINGEYFSGEDLESDSWYFNSNNFSIGGPGLTLSGGFKHFKFTLEYMLNFGYSKVHTSSYYEGYEEGYEGNTGFLKTHILNIGLSVGR